MSRARIRIWEAGRPKIVRTDHVPIADLAHGQGVGSVASADELVRRHQLDALEGFLARLVESAYADRLVLKGGVLLAALDVRRPIRVR